MFKLYLFLPLLVLGGCVSVPHHEAAAMLSVSPQLEQSISEGITQEVIVEALPPCQWWEVFENPSLTYLVERALENNPTLQEAMAKVDKARNSAKVKRSLLFPTLSLDGEVNNQNLAKNGFFRAYAPTIPAHVTEYTLDLDFRYELDFWGKRRNLYRAALSQACAWEAEKAQANLLITTAVAAVYFKLQADRRLLSLLQEQQSIYLSLVELRKRRQTHALDNANQVLAVENASQFIQQQLVWRKQAVELDEHLLLNLVGEGPDQEMCISQICLDQIIKVPIPEFLSSDLLAYRPDLMAQIWRVEAAAHEVGAAKADFYPDVNLNAFVGLDSVFYEKLFTEGSVASALAPAFHLPIFTAGRIQANLDAKRAILVEESQAYNRLLLEAARDVADKLSTLKAADLNLSLQSKIVQNRQESEQLVQQRVIHALNNTLESLEARVEVLQQTGIETDAQYQYHLAAIQLMRALGGGYRAYCLPITPRGA